MSIFLKQRTTGSAKISLKPIAAAALSCALLSVACGGAKTQAGPCPEQPAAAEQPAVQANIHSPADAVKEWQTALQYLKEGNKRFLDNQTITRNTNAADRDVLKSGQKPFAVVITCADSRVSPEIYFDQKLGDIFVIRNAGNIASQAALGSIEYAVEHLHSPLVIVVGHSSCGAVGGAFAAKGEHKDEHAEGEHAAPPAENLQTILNTITAAIANSNTSDEGIHANVDDVVKRISENKIVEHVKAKVIGAYYNIESGEVTFKD